MLARKFSPAHGDVVGPLPASSDGYTVTRLDVIFSYPDRVPLTHFVHREKKVFAMWA